MASFRLLSFFIGIAFMGSSPAVAQEATAESGAVSGLVRQPRGLKDKILCRKYGICNGGYGGGIQGGHQGYQGNNGGGYQQPYPPINIAISQSQSSANEAGGGYSHGYYPNNYQYNGHFPKPGYPNYQKPGGYFNNGQGSYNNQFNGNYYGPPLGQHGGGYGFQGPNGYFDEIQGDEVHNGSHDDSSAAGPGTGPGGYNDYNQGRSNESGQPGGSFALASAFAGSGKRN